MDYDILFGKNMKQARKDKGYTLQKVADFVGSSKSYIWEIEAGRSSLGALLAINIANALEVNIYDLYEMKKTY